MVGVDRERQVVKMSQHKTSLRPLLSQFVVMVQGVGLHIKMF